MKRKILKLLMAVCILAAPIMTAEAAANVQAETIYDKDKIVTSGEYQYQEKEDGTVAIMAYTGDEKNLNLPSTLDGKTVTEIGHYAFYNNYIYSVTIPETVTSIGDGAFYYCYWLSEVTIPESVTTLGEEVFWKCWRIEDLTIPKSVTTIGKKAFYGCRGLKNLTILGDINYIGDEMFYACDALTSVTITGKLTEIGKDTFSECAMLENVILPETVEKIGDSAFSSCRKLPEIALPDGLIDLGTDVFWGCTNLKEIVIPDGITEVKEDMFYNCIDLERVTLPGSVKSIGKGAFAKCDSLEIIYYMADTSQWVNITIGEENDVLRNVQIISDAPIRLDIIEENVAYTGEPQTPAVKVTDVNGQVLDASLYTLEYKNNVAVGQASVTVTGTGEYEGSQTVYFIIHPKTPKIIKASSTKSAVKLKWKKQKDQVDGFEIENSYAIKRQYKKEKLVTAKKKKNTVKVKFNRADRTYYMRIRSYKTVEINGVKQKLYSEWTERVKAHQGKYSK